MHKCPIIFSKLDSDPKASLIAPKQSVTEPIIAYQAKLEKRIQDRVEKSDAKESLEFYYNRPYRCNTIFGYTTLIDTEKKLKDAIFNRELPDAGLDKAECVALDYLRDGSFYSSTG